MSCGNISALYSSIPTSLATSSATSFLSPVNILVLIPNFLNFSNVFFILSLILSFNIIAPSTFPSTDKYRAVPLFSLFVFSSTSSLFPIFIVFPSNSYEIPFPDISLKFFTLLSSISICLYSKIDLAIG